MSSEGGTAGIVLAAGSSRRMGRPKLLLRLGGESLIRGCARRALGAGLDPLLVVVGAAGDALSDELEGLPCRVLANPAHPEGMGSSLACGLAAVPESSRAAVVILADMPFVSTSMLRSLVAHHRATNAPVVISRYGDTAAPPTLFGRALFEELRVQDGDVGGRELVRRHASRAATCHWPEESLLDVDSPEDYARAMRLGDMKQFPRCRSRGN